MRRVMLLAALVGNVMAVAAQGGRSFDPLVYRGAVAAVLDGRLPDSIAVGPVTVRLHLAEAAVLRGGQVNERLHQYDAIPAGLPERLDAASLPPHPARELPLPPGFTVLGDSAAALLEAGRWRELRRRAPASRGVIHLTPVVYDDRGGTALVGIIHDCGPGCRRMYAAWLVPDGTGGWTVQGTHRFPIE